jgi:hypothetical protein
LIKLKWLLHFTFTKWQKLFLSHLRQFLLPMKALSIWNEWVWSVNSIWSNDTYNLDLGLIILVEIKRTDFVRRIWDSRKFWNIINKKMNRSETFELDSFENILINFETQKCGLSSTHIHITMVCNKKDRFWKINETTHLFWNLNHS